MSHTVVGVFDSSPEAQTAVQQLVSNGFLRDNIDVSPQTTSGTTNYNSETDNDNDSIGSFFRNLFGGDDDRSDRYSSYARMGSIVTVHARSAQEAERAADILDQYGAVNLDERSSGYAAGTTGTGTTLRDTTTTDTTMSGLDTDSTRRNTRTTDTTNSDLDADTTRRDTTSSDTSIPIIEEELHVGKRTVETGGVRVRSRIIERPIEEHLRLREEHVHVERNPVNRPATEADLNSFREGDIELTEHAEVPMVEKEARVVEEVRIGKDVEEHDEEIRDTVRRTDVDIEDLDSDEQRRRSTDTDDLRQRRRDADDDRPHNL